MSSKRNRFKSQQDMFGASVRVKRDVDPVPGSSYDALSPADPTPPDRASGGRVNELVDVAGAEQGNQGPVRLVEKLAKTVERRRKETDAHEHLGTDRAGRSLDAAISLPDRPHRSYGDEIVCLSVEQVARRYSISPASVWRWVGKGKFPAPRKLTSGSTRWSVADLEKYERMTGLRP